MTQFSIIEGVKMMVRNIHKLFLLFCITISIGCGNGKSEESSSSSSGGTTDSSLTPVITSFSSPHYSGTGTHTLSGSCVTNSQIKLIGDSNITTTCTGGTFSFNVSFTTEGAYSFIIRAENLFNHNSATTSLVWYIDGTAPAAPTITSPTSNPFSSSGASVTITGACETGATVSYTESPGSTSGSQTCSTGSYSFNSAKGADGTYIYSLKQTDAAGNQSSTTTFTWQRDSSVPNAPVVTTINSIAATSPFYQNTNSITMAGTCPSGVDYTVFFEDYDNAANNSSSVCSAGTFSFNVTKSTDNSYNFGFYTVYTVNGNSSSVTNQTIVRDVVAPSTPVISNPASSPYTSAGNTLTITVSCELNATVNLTGDDTQSTTCTASPRSFTVTKTVDGTYNFSISQTDRAGNTSSSAAQQWIRASSLPVTPTITTPASSPLNNNAASITIAGDCTAGLTVTLSGNVVAGDVTSPASSLTQTCAAGSGTAPYDGNYSYTISKSSDNAYTFNIKQTNVAGDSGNATQVWNKDSTPPTITITGGPAQPTNYSANVSFTFTTNDAGSTTYCKINSGSAVVCTSPYNTSLPTTGAYTVTIYGVDTAGNSGLGVSGKEAQYSWSQNVNKTIALYNFENNFNSDSGDNNAEAVGASNFSTAQKKYGSYSADIRDANYGRILRANQSMMSRISNPATFEAFTLWPSSPSNGEILPIVSKNGTTSGNFGWEFGISKSGGAGTWLYLKVSCDGVNSQTILTTSKFNLDNVNFQHLAVAINGSNVYFYVDGVSYAAASGITGGGCNAGNGYSLFDAPVDLYIARNAGGTTMDGSRTNAYLDALRLSQVDRTSGGTSTADLCRGVSICAND